MSKIYQYFRIPYALVPTSQPPPYTVYYATWSTQPPVLEPGMAPPLVVGVTDSEIPDGSIVLGMASKDPPPPPPPPAIGIADFQSSISLWLQASRSADE